MIKWIRSVINSVRNASEPDILFFTEKQEDDSGHPIVCKAPLNHEDIARLAYYKWEMAGCPDGQSEVFWEAAKAEIMQWNSFIC